MNIWAMDWILQVTSSVKEITGYDVPILLAALLTLCSVVVAYTRLTSGRQVPAASDSSASPPSLPYWIPLFGHLPRWLFNYNETLEEAQKAFDTGISTLNLGSETHHIISSAKIADQLQASHSSSLSDSKPKQRIWHNVFGVPKNQLSLYHELVSAVQIPVQFHLEAGLDGSNINNALLRRLQGNIADFVSFNAGLIDQEPWEKISNVVVSEEQKSAEVSLLPLVFMFLTHMSTDTFISESILSDQDHLETGPLLLAFVQSYSLLMSGLPRWILHPALPGVHITRRKLLRHLDAVLDATEDSEMQNELMVARARMLDDHKTPRVMRTVELLRLLHGLNAPHVLAFWMLLHIISDPQLLEAIRKEARAVVEVIQEKPVMGFSVPPRITIKTAELLGPKTTLLKQCWLECARLYGRGQKSWVASADFKLDGDQGGVFKTANKWKVQKGDWLDIPFWQANQDGIRWERPEEFDPERHAVAENEDVFAATDVSYNPELFAMSEAMRPARLFAIAFVASAVLLYDLEIVAKDSLPKAQFAACVALPEQDVRVRVTKR